MLNSLPLSLKGQKTKTLVKLHLDQPSKLTCVASTSPAPPFLPPSKIPINTPQNTSGGFIHECGLSVIYLLQTLLNHQSVCISPSHFIFPFSSWSLFLLLPPTLGLQIIGPRPKESGVQIQ